MAPAISPSTLEALKALGTCTVANAIERLGLRLRNEGFTQANLGCRFPALAPMVGFASTLRLHGSNPPLEGGTYLDPSPWWEKVGRGAGPHILVIDDADRPPGAGAWVGATHASILQAMGYAGVVTNGAVRDLPEVKAIGFQLFSGSLSVSHAYAHVAAWEVPVEVAGLRVCPGDLLHGDLHGLVKIPAGAEDEVIRIARLLQAEEREVVAFCRSPEFSPEGLGNLMHPRA